MNLLLFEEADFISPDRVRIAGRRFRHIRDVHRALPGDELAVGVVGGRTGTGLLEIASDDAVELTVRLDADPPPKIALTVVLALPRPKVLARVLADLTSLGVPRIVLLNAWRVEKAYWSSPALAEEALLGARMLGLEQARDTVLPEVLVRRRFGPFVEDELETLWPGATCARLLAHPGAAYGPEGCDLGKAGTPAVLAIGPEGGWVPFELDLLAAHRFQAFGLGPRVLRVETAVPFAFGQVLLARTRVAGQAGDA